MRNLLLILFVSVLTIPTVAQKGSTLLYGNLHYQYVENFPYGGNGSNLSINPGIGFGFSDRWTGGLNFSFGFFDNSNYNDATFTYGAGPFVRYTHPLSELFSVFGQFETLFAMDKNKGGFESHSIYAGLVPAIELNIKNGFAINFSLGGINYSRTSIKDVQGSVNSLNVQFGSGMNIGVSKRFSRK